MTRTRKRQRRPAPPAISPERRAKLLEALRVGHDLEASAAEAGVSLAVIRADHELLVECGEAYRLGTAKLRSRMLEGALRGGDVHVLERAIAAREMAAAGQFKTAAAQAERSARLELSELTDLQLQVIEAVMSFLEEGDSSALARLDQILSNELLTLEAEMVRKAKVAAERAAARPLGELQTLDPMTPVPRERAVTPFHARS